MSPADPKELDAISELSCSDILCMLGSDQTPVSVNSKEGRRILASMRKGIVHSTSISIVRQLRERLRAHDNHAVLDHYEASYKVNPRDFLNQFAQSRRDLPFRLPEEEIVYASPTRAATVSRRAICAILKSLDASNVCEVGFGSGQNLLFLASQLKHMIFSGFELTQSGTELAKQLQDMALHETPFGQLYGISEEDLPDIRKVAFKQGSAFDLPAPDNAFDVVFTHSALEQMNNNHSTALSEIRRVARRYAIFHEPFIDSNDFWGKFFLLSNNYLNLKSTAMTNYGFRPIAHLKNLPIKPTFGYSILLAEIV